MRRNKGFTLIELLVVVSIIALLVSILLPALNKARLQTRRTMCMVNLRSMHTGSFAYASDYDEYPVLWATEVRALAGNYDSMPHASRSLRPLIEGDYVPARAFMCPYAGAKGEYMSRVVSGDVSNDALPGRTDYIYAGGRPADGTSISSPGYRASYVRSPDGDPETVIFSDLVYGEWNAHYYGTTSGNHAHSGFGRPARGAFSVNIRGQVYWRDVTELRHQRKFNVWPWYFW